MEFIVLAVFSMSFITPHSLFQNQSSIVIRQCPTPTAAGYGENNGKRVVVGDRGLEVLEKANIFVVEIEVYKTRGLGLGGKETGACFRKTRFELLQNLGDRFAIQYDLRLLLGVLADG